jgi:hypothetical protein
VPPVGRYRRNEQRSERRKENHPLHCLSSPVSVDAHPVDEQLRPAAMGEVDPAARKAVDEYLNGRVLLNRIDDTDRLAVRSSYRAR